VDLVDEAADGVGAGQEGTAPDPGYGLAHVGVQVAEGLQGERRLDAGLGLQALLQLVVAARPDPRG
jgi:hypothetical protein